MIKIKRLGNTNTRIIQMDKYSIKELKEIVTFWEGLKDYEIQIIY